MTIDTRLSRFWIALIVCFIIKILLRPYYIKFYFYFLRFIKDSEYQSVQTLILNLVLKLKF